MANLKISETEDEKNAWEGLLRRMLPAGAPLPDEEHLDYSISIDYIGPPLPSTSQTKKGPSIPTDPWRNPNSTTVAQKGKLSSKFTGLRGENVVRERQHDPQPEIENFTQPVGSPVRVLGLGSGDTDDSLDSDSNSMFSLKSFTIAGDQFDLQDDNLKDRVVEGEVISNLDSDSRFSLRSLFASTDQSGNSINKTSHLGNRDGENFRDLILEGEATYLGKRGTISVNAPIPIPIEVNKKKSVCTKCRKGTRLNLRETCIVFGARNCRNCRNCMCS